MLKQLLSNNRIFGGLVCLLVFIAAGMIYLQSVKRPASLDLPRTKPEGQIQPAPGGGHFHSDGTYHAEPHEPQSPSVSTTPVETSDSLPETSEQVPRVSKAPLADPSIHIVIPTNGQLLTAEQVVAYSTLINEYEKDARSLAVDTEVLKAESEAHKIASEAYIKKLEKHSMDVLANRADIEVGRVSTEEYLERYRLLLKEYREVLPRENQRLEEMWQALDQHYARHIEQERALKQREPEVARARRALEAHLNAK